jgi:hypothetical protein
LVERELIKIPARGDLAAIKCVVECTTTLAIVAVAAMKSFGLEAACGV